MFNVRHRVSTAEPMVFVRHVFDEIRETIGRLPVETGGILLGSRDNYIVQKFVFDPYGGRSSAGYDPDLNYLNRIVKQEWEKNRLALLGFVHSHPRGVTRLSGDWGNGIGDQGYLRRIFEAMPKLNKFLVPIVFSTADKGKFEMIPHVARRNAIENYETTRVELVDSYQGEVASPDLSRLCGAVDLELLRRTHIVAVGAGGAVGLYEDFARSGLGRLTVIDFDTVDRSNLSTQGYDLSDVGLPKVQALGNRISKIASNLRYQGLERDFLKLSEAEVEGLFGSADMLLFMTDNFHAQARGNRVALKLGKPAIFAIVYAKAWCAEITFMIPGVTPACHRCAVSSRYQAHEEGEVEEVRQERSTIFHTHYLNSCIGLLTMAILHRNTKDLEFSKWFGDLWERNLVQLRMHPRWGEWENSLFRRTFQDSPRVFNFDSVWQLIEPECPPKYEVCPDCEGKGSTLESRRFSDTRVVLSKRRS